MGFCHVIVCSVRKSFRWLSIGNWNLVSSILFCVHPSPLGNIVAFSPYALTKFILNKYTMVSPYIYSFPYFFLCVTSSKRVWQYFVDYPLIFLLWKAIKICPSSRNTHCNDLVAFVLNGQRLKSCSIFSHPTTLSLSLAFSVFLNRQFNSMLSDSRSSFLSDENAWNFYSFNFHHTTSVFYEWSNFVNTIMWMVVYISA